MIIKVCEVGPEEIKGFPETHWLVFNQDQGLDFKDEYIYFGAYSGDEIIGYARAKIRGRVLELKSLLVKKESRRNGVGFFLLAEVERYARNNNCRKIILKTSEGHKEAVGFYKKHGYGVYAVLENCYFGLDWYFFVKELINS